MSNTGETHCYNLISPNTFFKKNDTINILNIFLFKIVLDMIMNF